LRGSITRGGKTAMMKVLCLCGLILLAGFLGYFILPEKHTGFVQRIYMDAENNEWKYTLFVPAEYKGNRLYPLLVYLHGYGARGVDGDKPTTDGPGALIKEREKTFDMLVLFPQSESGSWEADTEDGQRVMAILEEVLRDYTVDWRRIYLTGTSAGGFGVWSLAARYPHKWAAIVPICGGGDPASVEAIQHIPCWYFHGACDKVIDVGQSRNMIAALRDVGAKPRYTEYPDEGHNCWGRAYATPELWDWLRRQRLGESAHIPCRCRTYPWLIAKPVLKIFLAQRVACKWVVELWVKLRKGLDIPEGCC
jgi:predicted peptidase